MSLEDIKKDLENISDKINFCQDIDINQKINIFLSVQSTIDKIERATKSENKKRLRDGDEDFQMVY